MSRFTVTVDPEILEEARRLAKVNSKRETIELALREYVRSQRIKELVSLAGSALVETDLQELDEWRAAGVEER
ncbi:MAG: type II toxin-antitoxin system VapB family antitoxin [Candidatus Bipolaricaulota bacterium]